MFSNRFNTKNDPLVGAVEGALKEGALRRQAEALVNEEFGVYSRRAVVREDLAAYDARLEEAYKCMKEGKPNDGNLANNYPPYDKVTRGDVIAGATGKDQMGGKKKHMEEGAMDKVKGFVKLGPKGMKKTDRIASKLSDRYGNWDHKKGEFSEKGKEQVKSRLKNVKGASDYALRMEEQIDELKKPTPETAARVVDRAVNRDEWSAKAANRLYKRYKDRYEKPEAKKEMKEAKKAWEEETDYSAPDRAAVTRDNKPSTPAQTNAATSGPSAADKAALSNKIKSMNEAAYSAKAARAGKDIGKPGKEFKRIAKSAAERYGSEERGKKVAGAILKRIRAKHMKEENLEELSAFGREFAAARRAGKSEFMSKVTGKMTSTALKGQSSTPSAPKASPVDAPSPKSQTGSSRMDALKSITNPTPTVSKTQNMGSAISTGSSSAMDKVSDLAAKQAATPGERTASVNKMQNMGTSISTGGSSAMDTVSSMGASQASDTQKAKDVAKGVTSFAQQSSITGGIGAASNAKDSRNKFSVDENKSLRESVQVGANKYRIV